VNVSLGSEVEPNGRLGDRRLLIGEQVLRTGLGGGGGLLDVGEQGAGGLESLGSVKKHGQRLTVERSQNRIEIRTCSGSTSATVASDALATAVDLDMMI